MGKIVRLKDIAIATGYTINTVSRALKDKSDISENTRKLIQSTAREMGYINDSIAGALRSGSTQTVALILGDISNPVYAILIKKIETSLRKHNYNTIIMNTEENYILEEQAIVSALSKKVDGIIICPTQKDDKDISFLQSKKVPFVLLGRRFDNKNYDYVIPDDKNAGYIATEYLIKKGHKNILALNGPQYVSSAKERLEGYRKALIEYGIEPQFELTKEVDITSGGCYEIVKKALKDKLEFTAIIAYSDLLAWETISVLNEFGYKVPDDFSVIGFDDIQSEFFFPVPLTTINTSLTEIAQKTVNILLEKISNGKNNDIKSYREIVPASLVIRGTT